MGVELRREFTVSYVSLTRMIEEYDAIVHSKVCETTIHQEYSKEVSVIQEDANKVCGQVQYFLSNLQRYKFSYQALVRTEGKLTQSIQILVKQCGSLTQTQQHLHYVQQTILALGNCPGLAVGFSIPTWTGIWVTFTQDSGKNSVWNDQ